MFTLKDIEYNICIVSYPRSGNTFLRNIFFDVFGLFSWNNYHRYIFLRETLSHPMVKKRDRFFLNDQLHRPEDLLEYMPCQIIKSHDLPDNNHEFLATEPFIICIIRDGRDAMVSEAHHRSNIVAPGSPFDENLHDAITAPGGSHFGGWSANVRAWLPRAHLVLHFEQLITDPVRCIEKIRSMISLPDPDLSRIPTFESQRQGESAFITDRRLETYSDTFPRLFFRRGEYGAWKEEMPEPMQQTFMAYHGGILEELGYLNEDLSLLKYFI